MYNNCTIFKNYIAKNSPIRFSNKSPEISQTTINAKKRNYAPRAKEERNPEARSENTPRVKYAATSANGFFRAVAARLGLLIAETPRAGNAAQRPADARALPPLSPPRAPFPIAWNSSSCGARHLFSGRFGTVSIFVDVFLIFVMERKRGVKEKLAFGIMKNINDI